MRWRLNVRPGERNPVAGSFPKARENLSTVPPLPGGELKPEEDEEGEEHSSGEERLRLRCIFWEGGCPQR